MPLPDFHSSDPFTLGIELELQVVNPPGYDLSQDSSALIAAVKNDIKAGEVKHDITESMLEIATGVCPQHRPGSGAVFRHAAGDPARSGRTTYSDCRRRDAPVPEVAASGSV
ncbi:carboxylate-amine ligase [Lelliottia amnigena]|nr:carboxylate-amine ligase [Lelliottia amnigena]